MASQFGVQPADFSLGLNTALTGIVKGAEAKQQRTQNTADEQAMADFGAKFPEMSGVEVGQFILDNPRIAKQITSAVDVSSKMTKEENLESAINVASAYLSGDTGEPTPAAQPVPAPAPPTIGLDAAPIGQTPMQAPVDQTMIDPTGQTPAQNVSPGQAEAVKLLTDRAELLIERGGDAKESIELTRDAMTGGEKAFKSAMAYVAAHDQPAFQALMDLQGGGEESTPNTDIDDFVSDGLIVYKSKNPQASEADLAKEGNRLRLQIKRAQKEEAGDVAGAKKGAEWDVIAAMAPGVEQNKAIAVHQGREEEKRDQTAIDKGLTAAESMPNLKRGIELLDGINTGGYDNVKLAAKRFFGVEGANEGELSNRLAKAVLSQLRNTFGAQFTEGEGQRLIRIEAGFDKSPENNMRLLKQALRMAQGKVDTAMSIAGAKGDQSAIDQITGWADFDLTPLPEGVTEDDIQETMLRNKMTRQQVIDKLGGK